MSRLPLTTRLLVGLVSAQVAAVLAAMLLFPLLAPFTSFNDIAELTLRAKLKESVVVERGEPVLRPTPALAAYVGSRPSLAYAVYSPERDVALPGSSDEAAAYARAIRPLFPREDGTLTSDRPGLPGDTVIVATDVTLAGRLVFVSAGNRFRAEDIPSIMTAFLPAILPAYAPVILGAFVLIPLLVRLLLRPLARLAEDAAALDGQVLERRLTNAGLGRELQALVRAINEALDRIQTGVARQMLYAANAAHELRTPMAVLASRIEQVPEDGLRTRLRLDLKRISSLLEQLVAIAKVGRTNKAPFTTLDLVEVVKDVIADRAPLAIAAGRTIALDTAPPTLPVEADRSSLESALGNVLDNAVRAEPFDGTILVTVHDDGRVEIVDHGPGLSAEERAVAFEPFWRKDDRMPGSGLGLSIVREVTRRHDALVDLAETPGGGLTVRFRFKPSASASALRQVEAMNDA